MSTRNNIFLKVTEKFVLFIPIIIIVKKYKFILKLNFFN